MTNANPKDGNGRQQAKKEKPVQREDALEQEQAQPEVSFANMQKVQQAIANPEDANRNDIKGVQRAMGNRFVQQMSRKHRPNLWIGCLSGSKLALIILGPTGKSDRC